MLFRSVNIPFGEAGWLTQQIDKYVPFFSATVLGTRQRYRAFERALSSSSTKQDREKAQENLLAMTTFMTIAGALYWAMYHDDDTWDEQPDWLKQRYWAFPGEVGRYYRIPKGYDWSILANLPIAALDVVFEGNYKAASQAIKYEFMNMDPTGMLGESGFSFPDIPVVKPSVEIWGNTNQFTGAPIVRKGEKKGPEYLWGEDRSSLAAANVARIGNVLGVNVAPPQIDHMMDSLSGGIWDATMVNPEKAVGRFTGIGAFYLPEMSRSINEFYETRQDMKAKYYAMRNENRDGWEDVYGNGYLMDKYAELFTDLRNLADELESKDNKDKADKIKNALIGLAREPLDKPPTQRYGNFWTRDDLPEQANKIRQEFRAKIGRAYNRTPYKRKDEEPKITFKKAKGRKKALQNWISNH